MQAIAFTMTMDNFPEAKFAVDEFTLNISALKEGELVGVGLFG